MENSSWLFWLFFPPNFSNNNKIFQTMNTVGSKYEISKFYPIRWKIQRLKNLSLWQKLHSFRGRVVYIHTFTVQCTYIYVKTVPYQKLRRGRGGSVEYFEKWSMRKLIQQELKVGKKQQLSSCYGLDFQMPMCLTLII